MMEDYPKEKYKDASFQSLDSEIIDGETSHIDYEVLTYPADYTLEGLVSKLDKGQIKIPHFQRRFVWSIAQASKLIESFLLGLPVPAIFLYSDKDEILNVIDGQQRLLSIYYFLTGYFGEEQKGKRLTFKLLGLKENNPYFEATYSSLRLSNFAAFNKLNNSVLRAFIVKQIQPKDNTSIYHIFERLNTGGTQLQGQEIRNCIYYGKFNDLIVQLNKSESWRKIFGSQSLNKHKRDEELILRFFALYTEYDSYCKPMKDFLSNFMANNRNPSDKIIMQWEDIFKRTSAVTLEILGEKPFILTRGLNVAIFDTVFTLLAKNINDVNKGTLMKKYQTLLKEDGFIKAVTSGTTDEISIKNRFNKCKEILFGK
jgi:uncharacterized protein with ParB-like and HNH nuclease domain